MPIAAITASTTIGRLELLGLAVLAVIVVSGLLFLRFRNSPKADRWWDNGSQDVLTYGACVVVACAGWVAGSRVLVGIGTGALILVIIVYARYERFG